MNDHTVFIVWSFAFGGLILAWTAISPLLKKRRLLEQLKRAQRQAHRNTDS